MDAEPDIDAYEKRLREEQAEQFQRLKDEAQALFGMVAGRPGVRSVQAFQDLLEKAGDEIGNGRFLVRFLGAERYLEPETVAVLLALRQNLIAEIGRPTAADIMRIDTAVVAYYNFIRTQGWIGNLSLVFEREVFGQTPLNQAHGATLGAKLREDLERLAEVILPLQERTQRMMLRALARVRPA